MDIQKEREAFQKFCEENFDFERHEQTYFDEQTQCYENDIGEDTESINMAWMAWQAAKAQAVPQWINVHLLSPQIDTEVLICVDDDVQLAVWRVDDCGGYFEDVIGEIKWWMPLPKAQEPAND